MDIGETQIGETNTSAKVVTPLSNIGANWEGTRGKNMARKMTTNTEGSVKYWKDVTSLASNIDNTALAPLQNINMISQAEGLLLSFLPTIEEIENALALLVGEETPENIDERSLTSVSNGEANKQWSFLWKFLKWTTNENCLTVLHQSWPWMKVKVKLTLQNRRACEKILDRSNRRMISSKRDSLKLFKIQ